MYEESISRTLIMSLEVIKYYSSPFITIHYYLAPVWKPPTYNSPYLNWRRGMYAMSTSVFLVSHKHLIHLYTYYSSSPQSNILVQVLTLWINSTSGQKQEWNTIFSSKRCSDYPISGRISQRKLALTLFRQVVILLSSLPPGNTFLEVLGLPKSSLIPTHTSP